ncbi:hypothetical protein GX51_07280 [Blastomyces parvus]|uniref:HMG box domain-containing protein n=1 Tax=Blastomyces parvus TaxID=2060905 RepID=A0A2B7WLW4_9EURO|nr:hypothetical protein GX51_07280 [Blastomyces parvus]
MSNTRPPSPPPSVDGELTRGLSDCSIEQAELPLLQNRLQSDGVYMQMAQSQPPLLQYTSIEMDPNPEPIIPGGYGVSVPYRNGDEVTYSQAAPSRTPESLSGLPNGTASRRTCVGRSAKPRVRRPARMRKRKVPKVTSANNITVPRPLSELTRGMRIPVRNMELHVTRSAEQRQREVVLRKGKIARPMNSFMLYRSAYAEATKEWCAQNNHQVVSQVAGISWPKEPSEVREYYEKLANLERDNHDKAHPNYKFAPNKSTNTPKKKKALKLKQEKNNDVKGQDFTMPSYQHPVRHMSGPPFQDCSFGSRTPTPMDRDSSYDSRQGTPFEQMGDVYLNGDMNRSSWQMSNPGRPHPGMISPPEQTHYYQPSIHQSQLGPNIEDVTFKKMGVPGMQYDGPGALAGLPGNAHPDLLQQQPLPQSRSPVSLNGLQVDPQLFEFDGQANLASSDGTNYDGQLVMWQMPNAEQQFSRSGLPSQDDERYISQPGMHPGLQQSMDVQREVWNENQVDVGGQFDDWISTGTPFEYGNSQQKHL